MPDQLLRWVELGSEPGVGPGPVERVRALLNTDDRFHGIDHLAGGTRRPRGVPRRPAPLPHVRRRGRVSTRSRPPTRSSSRSAQARPRWRPRVPTRVVAGLLAEVHRAHATGEWARLKACANPDCQWVYYDGSRNRSGRWCSMNECGDVMKARAYRRRARQA